MNTNQAAIRPPAHSNNHFGKCPCAIRCPGCPHCRGTSAVPPDQSFARSAFASAGAFHTPDPESRTILPAPSTPNPNSL